MAVNGLVNFLNTHEALNARWMAFGWATPGTVRFGTADQSNNFPGRGLVKNALLWSCRAECLGL